METIVLVLMLLVCFSFLLKQTFHKNLSVIVTALVCALFIGFMWPYAIEQSKTQIADWLTNTELMLDTAVLITIEVTLHITFCMISTHVQTTERIRKRTQWIYKSLRWFPGIIIFPVLFSTLVSIIFSLPGTSFLLTSWSMATGILILIPIGTFALRILLPEKEVRLELLFLINVLTAILGVITTVNGQTAITGISEINWKAFGTLIFIVLTGTITGFIFYHIQLKKRTNKLL